MRGKVGALFTTFAAGRQGAALGAIILYT